MTSDHAALDITAMRNSTVQYLHGRKSEIDMEPLYQRQGAIWSVEKQQLLIDSLVNEFDIPKIYFHQYTVPRRDGSQTIRWALIDGKQRLEAVFGFLENRFPLSESFVYLADGQNDAAGKTYRELASSHPALVSTLNATKLDVITIRTDDLELIEEMFSRLNEAVPLNAAEKRNAIGGPLPRAIRTLCEHPLFSEKLPFSNRRYRHFDLAAKFLYWTDHRLHQQSKPPISTGAAVFVRDVKKVRLDSFVRDMKALSSGENRAEADVAATKSVLDQLASTFIDSDPLLTSIGMVSLYYLLAELRGVRGERFPERYAFSQFEKARRVRRARSDEELNQGEYEMLEFSRLSQSPNDGSALHYRLTVLDTWLTAFGAGEDPMSALDALFSSLED